MDVHGLVAFARRLAEAESLSRAVGVDLGDLASLAKELLPDWYDSWLPDEREELRQTRLHTLEGVARVLSNSGRHADAIQAALAAIRLEPLRGAPIAPSSRFIWPKATDRGRHPGLTAIRAVRDNRGLVCLAGFEPATRCLEGAAQLSDVIVCLRR